jgi:hypothetical protein
MGGPTDLSQRVRWPAPLLGQKYRYFRWWGGGAGRRGGSTVDDEWARLSVIMWCRSPCSRRHAVPTRSTARLGAQLRRRPVPFGNPVSADDGQTHLPFAVKVFTVDGDLISAITGFVDPHLFTAFDLPDP